MDYPYQLKQEIGYNSYRSLHPEGPQELKVRIERVLQVGVIIEDDRDNKIELRGIRAGVMDTLRDILGAISVYENKIGRGPTFVGNPS
jgi:hypothetical protein